MRKFIVGLTSAVVLMLCAAAEANAPLFRGKLTIRDRSGFPFVTEVNGPSCYAILYVPAGGTVKMSGIELGEYDLFFDYDIDGSFDDDGFYFINRSLRVTLYP